MFYSIKFADSQSHCDHNKIEVRFGPFRYLLVLHSSYPHSRGVQGFFKPLQIFKPNKNLKKHIPICCFVCFELIFKESESFKLLIHPCGALHLVKILVQLCEQKFIGDFNPLSGKNRAAALYTQKTLLDFSADINFNES